MPGRFANRIANGRFTLDGNVYRARAQTGRQAYACTAARTVSGAESGSSASTTPRRSRSCCNQPTAKRAFPARLRATCVYRLLEPATLRVELTAPCDKPTIVNLTQHAYFNLDGSSDVRDHELTLLSDFYTPTDDELIPTGEIRAVAGTPFDFRQARTIRNDDGQTYDTNFVAARERDDTGLAPIARVALAAQRPDPGAAQQRARRAVL